MEQPVSAADTQRNSFFVPVSIGEVVDKITILRIKEEKIRDEAKLRNIRDELRELEACYHSHVGEVSPTVASLTQSLLEINRKLWTIEDDIRECERRKDFGETFIQLARAVYFTNDDRARVKREINVALGSRFIEEKSYADYGKGAL
jgi:hypothetical protein